MQKQTNDIQSLIDHGFLLLVAGKYNKAEELFLKAQAKRPSNPTPFIAFAHAAQLKNDNNLSLKRWKLAYDKFPDNLLILKGLGNIYLELKNLEEGSNYLIEAQKLEATSNKVMYEYIENGNKLLQAGDPAKAEEVFIEAQMKWPDKLAPFHAHHRLLETNRRNS